MQLNKIEKKLFNISLKIFVKKNTLLPLDKARIIVHIRCLRTVPGFQKRSNAIIAFVNNEGVVIINIEVVGPSMIGDPESFNRCFYIVETRVLFSL